MDQPGMERFLFQEARLLDTGQLRQWQELFADEFVYWVPANDPDADPAEHCSIIYAGPTELEDRLQRGESDHFWVGDPPFRTLHVVTNVMGSTTSPGECHIESNLVLYIYRQNDQRRDVPMNNLPALCEHRLVRSEKGSWRIAYKKVTLLNCDGIVPLLPLVI